MPGIFGQGICSAVARHGECNSRAFFSNPSYPGKKKGMRQGPFLKEGG